MKQYGVKIKYAIMVLIGFVYEDITRGYRN